MTALLTADEAAALHVGLNVILRAGPPVTTTCGDPHPGLFVAPQAWVALTGPCPTCGGTGQVWGMHHGPGDLPFKCINPDCRDGRRIVPLYTECPGCRGSGTVRGGYPDYDALDCPRCENDEGTVLVGRGSIEVGPIYAAHGAREPWPRHDHIYVGSDQDGGWMSFSRWDGSTWTDSASVPVDPLPVPGRDWGIVIDCVETA